MVTIYNATGTPLCSVSFNVGAKGYYSLMQQDYIVLPFSLSTPVDFPLGSYVDLTGVFDDALGGKLSKKYYVTSLQTPTYNTSTGGYDYELRLDAYYWLWNNYIFKYTPENAGSEASWSLTAALDVHLGVFLRNLTALGFTFNGTPFTYSIDDTVENKAVTMTYDNIHLLDALFSLGGKDYFDCDVWITESVIHFGRCELGSEVKLEVGVEASDMKRNDSKGTFATRVYAFGSTRNIPTNYRPVSEQAVVNGVVQKRLMLPEGTPYVDAYENMPQTGIVETVVVFDNVYPRRVGTLDDVTSRTEIVENEDGTQSTYTYYQYKDTGLTFKDEYILDGQELQVTFQSGKLNSMTFGVIFEPEGTEKGSQVWEIVGNENYGRFLPDRTLKPEDGDKYVLSGFDIRLVSDQYVSNAEDELLEETKKYVKKTMVDDGTYTVPLRSTWVRADELHRTFDVGQKVNLVNPAFFPNGRQSRVIGWEMNLDYPWDSPVYTVGESAQYSRLADIEDKVETLTYKGQTYSGNGKGVYVIRTNDTTPASDSNVFSALRSLATFLRKDAPDVTEYLLRMMSGAEFGETLDSLIAGKGTLVTGDGRVQTDRLEVRGALTVLRLVVNEILGMQGDASFTETGMIEAVEDLGEDTYRLRIERRTAFEALMFREGNILYSIVNDLPTGGTSYYTSWMRVVAVNTTENTVTVVLYADGEVPGGVNYAPQAGYYVTRRGDARVPEGDGVNGDAQSWLISSREGRMMFLANVYKPVLEDWNYALVLGKLPKLAALEQIPVKEGDVGLMADVVVARQFYRFDGNGNVVTDTPDRGEWSLAVAEGEAPYRYVTHEMENPSTGYAYTVLEQHTVWHLGCKWGCLVDKTVKEPKWNSTDWVMLEGDPNYVVTIESTTGSLFRRSAVRTDLAAVVWYGNIDITDDVLATAGTEVEWLRDTGRPGDDAKWTADYVDGRLTTIRIDNSDGHGVGADFGYEYREVKFTCRVFVPVGGSQAEKMMLEGEIEVR